MEMLTATTTTVNGLDVVVSLHTTLEPRPESWDRYLAVLFDIKRKRGGDISHIRNLVVSDGGAPNAQQRVRMHNEAFDGNPNKIAVLTNSLTNPLKRGIATAISWVNPAFKALPPERWREGLVHLDLDGEQALLLDELERLQKQLPPVKTLALFARAVRGAGAETRP
jgi:hypothetical protein